MSLTCYASLSGGGLGSVGPPAQIGLTAGYSIVNTATNTPVLTSNGSYAGSVDVLITCPVASQAAILPAVQAAIQANEPATPSLSFIWIGL